jgi:DNA-binding NarL/FixJ family response regulator
MPLFRVVLSDHQKLFLQSISKNIEEIPGLEVIGEVGDGHNLLELLNKTTTDMVIIDVDNLQHLETVREIKRTYPKVKILILLIEESEDFLRQAILAGADGYMFKKNAYSDLITAIEKIRQGGSHFCNIISAKMAEIIRYEMGGKFFRKSLTTKEIRVLTLRCESKSIREIAELLSRRPGTIRSHLSNIKKKLNLKTQSDLIKYAIKQGYIR